MTVINNKQKINVDIATISDHVAVEVFLDEIKKAWRKAIEEGYMDIKVKVDTCGPYNDAYEVWLCGSRIETDKEYTERTVRESQYKKLHEANEKDLYRRLKAKFEKDDG